MTKERIEIGLIVLILVGAYVLGNWHEEMSQRYERCDQIPAGFACK